MKNPIADKKYLADLEPGQEATIGGRDSAEEGYDRLCELGLIEGTTVRMIKYAPLGDPLEIKVRGFYLSLRKSMARLILVRTKTNGHN